MKASIRLLCSLLLWANTRLVSADETTAYEHYRHGMVLYKHGDYDAALHEFESAHALEPAGNLLYNIAQSHWRLGHHEEAIRYYQRYLEAAPDAPNRPAVEIRIENLRVQLADSDSNPPLRLQLGEQGPRNPGAQATDSTDWLQVAAWTTAGVAVATLAVGVGFGLAADEASADASRAVRFDMADIDDGQRLESLQYVFLGAAAVSATTSVLLFILDGQTSADGNTATVSPLLTAGHIGVSGQIRM